jgi:hypothetical protein
MKQLLFDITFVTFLCYKSDLSVRFSCIFLFHLLLICFDEIWFEILSFLLEIECFCQSVETENAGVLFVSRTLAVFYGTFLYKLFPWRTLPVQPTIGRLYWGKVGETPLRWRPLLTHVCFELTFFFLLFFFYRDLNWEDIEVKFFIFLSLLVRC